MQIGNSVDRYLGEAGLPSLGVVVDAPVLAIVLLRARQVVANHPVDSVSQLFIGQQDASVSSGSNLSSHHPPPLVGSHLALDGIGWDLLCCHCSEDCSLVHPLSNNPLKQKHIST